MQSLRSLFRLAPYLLRHRRALLVGVACTVLGNLFEVWGWARVMTAIDTFNGLRELRTPGSTTETVLLATGIAFSLFAAGAVFRFLMRWLMIGASRRIEFELRNDLFAHLTRLSPSYYDRKTTGDLMSRATNDLEAVRAVLGPGIMYPIHAAVLLPAVLVMMVRISPTLTLLSLTPLLATPVLVRFFSRTIHHRFKDVQQYYGRMSDRVRENLAGIRVVKSYAREDEEIGIFRRMNEEYRRRTMRLMGAQAFFFPLLRILIVLSQIVLIGAGVRLIGGWWQGELTYGGFFAFFGLHAEIAWPLIALGWVVNVVERGAVSMNRLAEVLDQQPEIPPPAVTEQPGLPRITGGIEFRNLTFSYDGQPVLRDISLVVEPGTILGIVGPVGCGKSTLLRLLPRLYAVPPAQLFIDGRDINEIPLHRLRRAVGMVPQEAFLFSDTLRDNILFGAGDEPAGVGALERAADRAELTETVQDFPRGFDTILGERGINLSGGQKQRTALARALIRDPAIVLLDDCLASVDAETETQILKSLEAELAGRTALVVSHRISTVAIADAIVVLKEGRIVERGTHDELLARGGLYAQLARRQRLIEEIEREDEAPGGGGDMPGGGGR